MSFGQFTEKTDTIASAASTSAGVKLGGKPMRGITVYVPSMSTAHAITVQGSVDGGTTYVRVFHPTINSATVGCNPIIIPTGVVTGGAIHQLPVVGVSSVRFVCSDVVDNGLSIKVLGYD